MFARPANLAISRLSQITKQSIRRSMATQSTKFKLNTGAEIPAIGFGTWNDAHAQEVAVKEALKCGYRHIDTARMYVEPSMTTPKCL